MTDLKKKATSIITYEAIEQHPRVREKQGEMHAATKRNFTKPRESGKDRSQKARQGSIEERKALLAFPLKVGRIVTLRHRQKIGLNEHCALRMRQTSDCEH